MSVNVARQAPLAPELPQSMAFGPEARRLFGWYHAPRGAAPRHLGVVLCNPLGYEAMPAHRTYRHLAARLAESGFPVLRFDYDGTGDSAGYDDEPGRVAAWLASIGTAIDEVKRRSGVSQVCLFGLRLGGLFALTAAAEREDVRALMLWATPATGRAYVRELRAFRQLKEKDTGGAAHPPDARGEEIAGYLLAHETAEALAALRPLETPTRAVRQALLIGRDDLPGAEAQLAKHLTDCGVEVSSPNVPGYSAAMRDAEFTELPEAALGTLVDWLGRVDAAPVSTVSMGGLASGAPSESALVCAAPGGAQVRERAVRFGRDARLFGIVAEPVLEAPSSDRAGVLFVSVGANHRTGPNRMHVTMSRELAGRGFVAMRLDIAGVGDSPPAPGEREHPLYSKASVRDIQEAMDWMSRTYGLRRFVVASLCSGAFLTFHASVQDERVAGQVLINPQTFVWRTGDSLVIKQREQRPAYETSFKSTRFYRSAVLRKETWRRLLRGEIQVRRIARELLSRAIQRVKTLPLPGPFQGAEQREHQAVRRSFSALVERGVKSLLVYSANDGGLDVIERYLGPRGRRLAKSRNFRMEVVDGPDHTFTPLWSQVYLATVILEFITTNFG